MNFIRLPGSHYHLSAARRWLWGAVGPAGCGGCGHSSSTRGPPQPQPPLGLLPCSPGTQRRSCLPWVVVGGKYFPQPRLCGCESLSRRLSLPLHGDSNSGGHTMLFWEPWPHTQMASGARGKGQLRGALPTPGPETHSRRHSPSPPSLLPRTSSHRLEAPTPKHLLRVPCPRHPSQAPCGRAQSGTKGFLGKNRLVSRLAEQQGPGQVTEPVRLL